MSTKCRVQTQQCSFVVLNQIYVTGFYDEFLSFSWSYIFSHHATVSFYLIILSITFLKQLIFHFFSYISCLMLASSESFCYSANDNFSFSSVIFWWFCKILLRFFGFDPWVKLRIDGQLSLDAGLTREFRVVRDNRVSQNGNSGIKPVQTSTSAEPVVSNTSAQRYIVLSCF